MDTLSFTKMVGAGNDFVVLNNMDGALSIDEARLNKFAFKVCQRRVGVGADGLLVLEPSQKADFKMRILNPDGDEVSMCGNGSRCAARFAFIHQIAKERMTIETLAGSLRADIIGEEVKVKMTDPEDLRLGFSLDVDGKDEVANFVNTGVEHVVIFVDDVDSLNVVKIGSKVRYHKQFAPRGANANFVELIDKENIKVRTYERGVENETLACGTGATASAIIAGILKGVTSPVRVKTKGGCYLRIFFKLKEHEVSEVYMQGDAQISYEGKVKYV